MSRPVRQDTPRLPSSVVPRLTYPAAADTGTELDVGDRVLLPKHGRGRITAVDGNAVIVGFTDGRSRKFKREFARPVKGSP